MLDTQRSILKVGRCMSEVRESRLEIEHSVSKVRRRTVKVRRLCLTCGAVAQPGRCWGINGFAVQQIEARHRPLRGSYGKP